MKTLYIYKLLDNGKIEKTSTIDYYVSPPNIHGYRAYRIDLKSYNTRIYVTENDLDKFKTLYLILFSGDEQQAHKIILAEMTKRLTKAGKEVNKVINKYENYKQIVIGLQKGV